MNKNYKELLEIFKTISKMKWVKGVNNFTSSVGFQIDKEHITDLFDIVKVYDADF